MEALEVFAIDKARCRVTGSIPYTSLVWSRRYYECGYFMMVVPSSIYSPDWAYICTPDRPETGRIQKVEYQDTDTTGEGDDTITLWGYFLESYMYDHTFLVEEKRQWQELVQSTRPHNPMANIIYDNQKKTLYKNSAIGYVCTDSYGNYVKNGGIVSEDMIKESEQIKYSMPINAFFYNDEAGDLHWVTATGDDVNIQNKVLVSDGTTSYFDNGGMILKASGTVSKTAIDTYKTQSYHYRNKTKRTITVKGYWQTTEIGDVEKNIDPIQHLAQWVSNFYQNGLIIAEPTFSAPARVINPSLRSLGEVLYDELKLEQASFRIIYDFELDKMVFEIYRGDDKTQSQSHNPWSVFSDEWGTLYDFDASSDTSNYKNTCYVLYEYDEPKSWDGNSPHIEKHYAYPDRGDGLVPLPVFDGWYIPYNQNYAYEKVTVGDDSEPERAIYLDLRDRKPDADNDWSRDVYDIDSTDRNKKPTFENTNIRSAYKDFKQGLLNEGLELLKNDYSIIENLDTGTLNLDRYLTEFDLGDKVDMSIAQIGVMKECRIIGVDETYEANDYSVSVIMGDEKVTSTRKVGLI